MSVHNTQLDEDDNAQQLFDAMEEGDFSGDYNSGVLSINKIVKILWVKKRETKK